MSPDEFDRLEKKYLDEFIKENGSKYSEQFESLKKDEKNLISKANNDEQKSMIHLSSLIELQMIKNKFDFAKRRYIFKSFMTDKNHD